MEYDITRVQAIAEEFKKEIRVEADGQGFATVRGVARICGVAQSTLVCALKGERKTPSKLAEFLLRQGINPERFSESGVPDIAVALIVVYYASMAGARRTEQASLVNLAIASVGMRTWMQQVAGFEASKKECKLPPKIAAMGDIPNLDPMRRAIRSRAIALDFEEREFAALRAKDPDAAMYFLEMQDEEFDLRRMRADTVQSEIYIESLQHCQSQIAFLEEVVENFRSQVALSKTADLLLQRDRRELEQERKKLEEEKSRWRKSQ